MKVYITCLNSYNNGFLIGKWHDLDCTEEELTEAINEVLKEGQEATKELCEEYFITDYEQEHNLFEISEYSNVYELREKYELISDLSEDDLKRISYLTDHVNYSFEEALERYEDVIIYEDMTLEDVVEEYIEQTIDFSTIPDIINRNIDYKSIAYDFEISGEYDVIDNNVYHYIN